MPGEKEDMRKNEIHWAIFSGLILLPFTIRRTKRQAITDHLLNRSVNGSYRTELLKSESCQKVVINKWKEEDD